MSSTVWFLVLFCGLTLAQEGTIEGEITVETQSCFPDMCKFLEEFGAMKEKQKAMETKLQETELRSKGVTKVVFSTAVGGTGPYGPFDTDTTLIYRTVFLNVGSAYNQHTGIFTAPVAGAYYFSFFYHAGGDHQSKLLLYKNSEVMAITSDHVSETDTADNGGNAVFLQLQQGDQVFVKMEAKTFIWGNNYHTTFSGFLVTEI